MQSMRTREHSDRTCRRECITACFMKVWVPGHTKTQKNTKNTNVRVELVRCLHISQRVDCPQPVYDITTHRGEGSQIAQIWRERGHGVRTLIPDVYIHGPLIIEAGIDRKLPWLLAKHGRHTEQVASHWDSKFVSMVLTRLLK